MGCCAVNDDTLFPQSLMSWRLEVVAKAAEKSRHPNSIASPSMAVHPCDCYFRSLLKQQQALPSSLRAYTFSAQSALTEGGAAQTFQEEHFYAWQYERPSSPYTILLSALLAIVVLACCLFPLAPQAMKVGLTHLCLLHAEGGLLA